MCVCIRFYIILYIVAVIILNHTHHLHYYCCYFTHVIMTTIIFITVTILYHDGMVSHFCILLTATTSIILQCAVLPHFLHSLHVGFCHCRVCDADVTNKNSLNVKLLLLSFLQNTLDRSDAPVPHPVRLRHQVLLAVRGHALCRRR